jgi:hypothetical protein
MEELAIAERARNRNAYDVPRAVFRSMTCPVAGLGISGADRASDLTTA